MAAPRAFSFLVPGDWSTPTGGYQYDRRLAQALDAAGWRVDLLRLDADWPTPDAVALAHAAAKVASLAAGTRVVADGLAFGATGATGATGAVGGIGAIGRIGGMADIVAAHAERLRWVALVHHPLHLETGLAPALRQQLLASETRALQLARHVVVTSPHTARDVAAMGVAPERITVVEPGTDAWPQALADAAASAPTAGPVRLLCVATLTPRKGHALLLQALAGLKALPWQLHCVGSHTRDPATSAVVRALAHDSGLAERVVWHGEVDAAALQAQYAAADLLVLASLHEGYGMVVAEALAAGLPVLASDAGALAQTLPPPAGWRVPVGDVPALQAALQRLISDTALRARLAAGARAAGRQLPDWPAQAARFATVLDSL